MAEKNNTKPKIESEYEENQEIDQDTDVNSQDENMYANNNGEEQAIEQKKNSKIISKQDKKLPKTDIVKENANTKNINSNKTNKEKPKALIVPKKVETKKIKEKTSSKANKKENSEDKKEKKDKKKNKAVPIIIGIVIIIAICAGIFLLMNWNDKGQTYTNIIISKVDTPNGIQFVADKDGPVKITDKDLQTTEVFYKLQGMNLNKSEILNQTLLRKILLNNAVKYAPNDSVVKAQNDAMFAEFDKASDDIKNMTLQQVNMTLPKLKEISLQRLKEDMTIKSYIENEILVYLPKEKAVNASHVLICFEGAYMCKENRTKTQALQLAIKIQGLAKTQDFGGLAAQYSDEPGAQISLGNLGFFPKGAMVPEFENAAFNLSVGEVSTPVETTFGYHVIKVFGISEIPSQEQATKIEYTLFSQILEKAYS